MRPVREFVLRFVPPSTSNNRGGSCMQGVDNRAWAWEGKSNPFPKKYCCQKYFRQKYFRQKYFLQKYYRQKNFRKKYFCQKYFCKKYFRQKYFSKKNFLKIFFEQNIAAKNIFTKNTFQKKFTKNISEKILFAFAKYFSKKKVGAKPLCCPQGLG